MSLVPCHAQIVGITYERFFDLHELTKKNNKKLFIIMKLKPADMGRRVGQSFAWYRQ